MIRKAKEAKAAADPGPVGSSFESWLDEEGIREEVRAGTAKAVLAWQLAEEMTRRGLNKADLARLLQTSRTEIYRLLDPKNEAVSISTLRKAAEAVGKKLRVELVDAA